MLCAKREFFLGTISSWRRPLYNSHLQPHGHYTHYTFNLMSVIHNTPSTAWPLYTLHLQPHGHYTHYTFNRMSIIHNSPSTRWPLYTFHLQPHGRYTIITFEHMAIIHMYPQTDGHYTHVPWGKKGPVPHWRTFLAPPDNGGHSFQNWTFV